MDKEKTEALFQKYIRKLRVTPAWDVRLEFVDDPAWTKTGDFKIDCDDRKAVLMLNARNPKQENPVPTTSRSATPMPRRSRSILTDAR